jgi:hypothetical protein
MVRGLDALTSLTLKHVREALGVAVFWKTRSAEAR